MVFKRLPYKGIEGRRILCHRLYGSHFQGEGLTTAKLSGPCIIAVYNQLPCVAGRWGLWPGNDGTGIHDCL